MGEINNKESQAFKPKYSVEKKETCYELEKASKNIYE